MKSRTFKIIGVIGAIIAALLIYAIMQYNKPHIDIRKEKVSIKISSDDIIDAFEKDELGANKKYTDKIIQIKGIIFDISIKDGNSVIALKRNDQLIGILCNMIPEDNIRAYKLQKGDSVALKGICTGYLLDIIMINCVLINEPFNEKE